MQLGLRMLMARTNSDAAAIAGERQYKMPHTGGMQGSVIPTSPIYCHHYSEHCVGALQQFR